MKQRKDTRRYHLCKWKKRSLGLLLLCFCLGIVFLVQFQCCQYIMEFVSLQLPVHKPKIALLFIARNRLPLDVFWDAFLEGEESRFSIFVHSRPGFIFYKGRTKSDHFVNRQVNDSVQVDWGEASMIEAERILLRHALEDPWNQRFIFLSDSCIPIYNFSYTYSYIMSTGTSFVDSFPDVNDGRYNPKMDPVIPVSNWRKGSQWVVLNRRHAQVIMNDFIVFPLFKKLCKLANASVEHNCVPDEHYVQTVVAQEGLEAEITRRSLTYSMWDPTSSKDHQRRGWHPFTYKSFDATPGLIKFIKSIDNIYFEATHRREWCRNNGKSASCFLFARKFTHAAALRLLSFKSVGLEGKKAQNHA